MTCRIRLVFEALLVNATSPPIHPAIVGEKITFKSILCPAAIVAGRVKPETLNAEPFTAMPETVALVSPVFVSVTNRVSDCPNKTVPNFKLDGEHTSCCVTP